jgi:hypothetical protein
MWEARRHVPPMQLCAQDLIGPEIVLKSPSLLSRERSALAAEVLRRSGRLRLQVHGESMLPTIWPRTILEIASCCVEDAKPGEIVLAMCDGRLFLHRFVERDEGGFVLRGDSMPGRDPVFENGALLGKLVDGGVASRYSSFPFVAMCRAIGRVFCYCGPLRRRALHLRQRWEKWGQEQKAAVTQTVHLEAEC